jgi:cytoskeletal protein CcmA (bactofilin family)
MKVNFRSLEKNQKTYTTAIFEGLSVKGDVKGSHNLFLNGEFEGTIDLTALLFVGKTGKLKGEVKAEYVIIEGEVEGKVMAHEKVELRDTGKYRGEILTPAVMISDNAFFDGTVKMLKEGQEAQVLQETETIHNPHPEEEILEEAR